MVKNVIVAQSGGPSSVINSSLRGVVETCHAMPDVFGTVYAGYHSIEGVLPATDLRGADFASVCAAGAAVRAS